MNLNSGEIHRLNIKSLSKWPYLWRCCRYFAAQVKRRASACTFDHLFNFFNCQACVRAFALHSFVLTYSVHGTYTYGTGYIRLLFKLLLKFRNVLKHTERRSSLACNQSIKEDIPTALEVFLCFETKRNDINFPRNHPRNA